MAYAGLETIFQNVGPTYGAVTAGEREGTSLALDQIKAMTDRQNQEKAAAELERYKQMTPLELEKATLSNRKLSTETVKGERTLESDVASSISKNDQEVLANKLKAIDSYSTALGSLSSNLETVPPAARHATMLQMVQGYGIDPQDPKLAPIMQTLSRVPADQLPQALLKFRQRVIQQGAAYQQAMDTARFNKEAQERMKGMELRAQKELEQMRIDAGKYKKVGKAVMSIEEGLLSGKLTYEKAATMISGMAFMTEDEGERNKLLDIARKYEQAELTKRAAGATGKVDVEAATGMPTQKPQPALGGTPAAPKLPPGWIMK